MISSNDLSNDNRLHLILPSSVTMQIVCKAAGKHETEDAEASVINSAPFSGFVMCFWGYGQAKRLLHGSIAMRSFSNERCCILV
jgi:hypothetical protein